MSEFLTCQRVLATVVLLGFMVHHMLRVNISIAIVEMVVKNDTDIKVPRYNWTEQEKNDILGYFFWGYVLTQVPGGRLSEILGAKMVIGTGLLLASLLTLIAPIACYLNYYCLVATRFFLGVALGVQWPGTPPIATKWISPDDTSKFMSHMTASSLGVAITLPACGYLISYWGWPSVFYVTGSIALVWTISWFYLVYDSPEQHPRISNKEKERLRSEVKVIQSEKNSSTPWIKILTSGPIWAFIIANTCLSFTFFVTFTQLPTYMSQVLHFNIQQNGWLSSLPYLVRYFTSIVSSIAADKLLKMKKFSKTTVRKMFTTVLFLGISFLFLVQVFWGYDRTVSVVVFTGSFACIGLSTPGFLANCVDIAPKYAGTIFGISQVPLSISGYLLTQIVAFFTKEEQGFEQWTPIFWILVGVNLFAAIFFLIFASGEEQSWKSEHLEVEMEKLN